METDENSEGQKDKCVDRLKHHILTLPYSDKTYKPARILAYHWPDSTVLTEERLKEA